MGRACNLGGVALDAGPICKNAGDGQGPENRSTTLPQRQAPYGGRWHAKGAGPPLARPPPRFKPRARERAVRQLGRFGAGSISKASEQINASVA